MNIVVCVKQVPGAAVVEIDPETGVLKRDGVDAKLNPYDLYAIEAALALSEKTESRVTALSMGPPQACAALLETLYMGVDHAILISDRRFAGSDVLATAYTLSQAISGNGFDVIICGKQTTDGDTAQVGAELAEFLGIPHVSGVMAIHAGGDGDEYSRGLSLTTGLDDQIATLYMPLPCLLCMDGGINTPRLPSYKRKRNIAPDSVQVVSLLDFEDKNEMHYGLNGSPTQVERTFPPEVSERHEIIGGGSLHIAERLTAVLIENKFI